MELAPANHKEVIEEVKACVTLYRSGLKHDAELHFRNFLSSRLPDAADSICYESFNKFALDKNVKNCWAWVWKNYQTQWEQLIKCSESYSAFNGFLKTVDMKLYVDS